MKNSEFIRKENITVRVLDLPTTIRGFCWHDENGQEFIAVNARLTREQNKKTMKHELKHIKAGDMFNPNFNEYGGTGNAPNKETASKKKG